MLLGVTIESRLLPLTDMLISSAYVIRWALVEMLNVVDGDKK